MAIVTVTEENFDSILADNDLVVLDFWAPWCSPCITFNEVIEKVSEKCAGVVFAKLNIDEQPALKEEFDVQSVPAVLIVRSQTVVLAQSGVLPAGELIELIEQAKQLDPAALKKEG
jgi:thioredoxin 1